LRLLFRFFLFSFFLFSINLVSGQHNNTLVVYAEPENKTLTVEQEITYFNATKDTLKDYILNDWNNAYSDKNSKLAKRFSDEFYRGFHLAKDSDRGLTTITSIVDQNNRVLEFSRVNNQIDLIDVHLVNPIYPNQKFKIKIKYTVTIPNNRFTRFGADESLGSLHLKNWFLTPARIENNSFIKNSNENLDDIANALADYDIQMTIPSRIHVFTDLESTKAAEKNDQTVYHLKGKNIQDFNLIF